MKKVLFLFVLVLSFSLKAQLTALITYEGESCQFSNDARILVDASGGDGNYVYAVSVSGGTIPDESFFTHRIII